MCDGFSVCETGLIYGAEIMETLGVKVLLVVSTFNIVVDVMNTRITIDN